jgi:hypothetical protein
MKYKIPESWINATEQERKDIANGCGAKGWKFDVVPDTIWGLSISKMCDWHDFDYTFLEKTQENKDIADSNFLHNIEVKIHKTGGFFKWFRLRRAKKYYYFVSKFGDSAFFG